MYIMVKNFTCTAIEPWIGCLINFSNNVSVITFRVEIMDSSLCDFENVKRMILKLLSFNDYSDSPTH
jgi:hypothetical protein